MKWRGVAISTKTYVVEGDGWWFELMRLRTEREPGLGREDYKVVFDAVKYQTPLKLANYLPPY